jgi:hypothetical protein
VTPNVLRNAWLRRLTSARGYADCLRALEDTFRCEGRSDAWFGGISIQESAQPDDILIGWTGGDERECPVRLRMLGAPPEWLPAAVRAIKRPVSLLAGSVCPGHEERALVAAEMAHLDRLLCAFWEDNAPVVALYRVRWEHLAFYARGYQGALPRPEGVAWPAGIEWEDEVRYRIRGNLRSEASRAVMDRLTGQEAELTSEEATILLELAEAMPWHAFGDRFGRLFPAQEPTKESPATAKLAWQLERLARSLTSYRPLPEPATEEILIPVESRDGFLGAISLAGAGISSRAADLQRQLAEAAAMRICAVWDRGRQEERTTAILQVARRCLPEEANPTRVAEEIWRRMFLGEPVLWARATLGGSLGAKFAKPSSAFPELLPVADPGELPNAERREFPVGAGADLKVQWIAVPGMQIRRDWDPWIRQWRDAFSLLARTQLRRLEDWFARELLRGVEERNPLPDWAPQILRCLEAEGKGLTNLVSETGDFKQHLTHLLAWRKLMEWQTAYLQRRTTIEDRDAPLADVVGRAALIAAFLYYVSEPRSVPVSAGTALPCRLEWAGEVVPLRIDGIEELMGGTTFPLGGIRYSDEFLANENLRLDSFRNVTGSVSWAPGVRFALEVAFLLVMKHHAKTSSFDVKLETLPTTQALPDFVIKFPCGDLTLLRKAFEDAPIQDHLRTKVSALATVSVTGDAGSAVVVLNFQFGRRHLLSLLTHNMRLRGRMLHHHYYPARNLWPREKPRYQSSVSDWHPESSNWGALLKLGDAIDLLWEGYQHQVDWADAKRECLDLSFIWPQFRLMQSKGQHATDVTMPDHAPRLDRDAFFLYLPELYEILLHPEKDSLLKESKAHCAGEPKILLALNPGDPRAWKERRALEAGHDFWLYWADQGPGVSVEKFAESMEDETPGTFRRAIERARLWCEAVTVYTKQVGGEVFSIRTEKLGGSRQIAEPGEIPQNVWDHFTAKSGFCVEFRFRVMPEAELVEARTLPMAPVPVVPEGREGLRSLGVIVVDEVSDGGHRDLHQAFRERRFVLVDDWEKFDSLTALQKDTWLWDELLVHKSDFTCVEGDFDKLLALISPDEATDTLFASRGRRARKIIVFTDGTSPIQLEGRAATVWRRAVRDDRLEFKTKDEMIEFCGDFSLDGLCGKLRNAQTENRPAEIALLQRRRDILYPGEAEL